jgi:hypothetical protein
VDRFARLVPVTDAGREVGLPDADAGSSERAAHLLVGVGEPFCLALLTGTQAKCTGIVYDGTVRGDSGELAPLVHKSLDRDKTKWFKRPTIEDPTVTIPA